MLVLNGSAYEVHKQRVRIEHRAAVLGVILRAYVPLLVGQFYNFDKFRARILAHATHTSLLKLRTIKTANYLPAIILAVVFVIIKNTFLPS